MWRVLLLATCKSNIAATMIGYIMFIFKTRIFKTFTYDVMMALTKIFLISGQEVSYLFFLI
jgi:hypothetical protein